jgi:glycosyltransferase involved in cell wall biosynthesis
MPTVLNPSGISKASREIYKLIRHLGFKVSTLLTLDEQVNLLEKPVSKWMIADSANFHDDVIQLHVGPPNNMSIVKSARAMIGMFVMEGQRLSSIQAEPCRRADVCAVPSTFCAKACLASGIPRDRVRIVPYPLDSSRWNVDVQPYTMKGDRFRFLYMNSIYERKGLDVLLKAYWLEFGKNEPVLLTIKSYRENDRPDPATTFIAKVAQEIGIDPKSRAPIAIIDEPIKDDDVPGFVKSFDAVVSPHRSEGFGMGPWYAMALGVPVICTDYGGVTDFATDDSAWLIDVEAMKRPSLSEVEIFGHLDGIVWAEPSVESAREQMRRCASEPEVRAKKAEEGANFVADRYSYDAIGKVLVDAFDAAYPGASKTLEKIEEGIPIPPRFNGEKPVSMIEV